MEQKDIEFDDVKEYRPRKKGPGHAVFMDNYNLSPVVSDQLMSPTGLNDNVEAIDNGHMLSTSEVIDFGEGTDSWTNQH